MILKLWVSKKHCWSQICFQLDCVWNKWVTLMLTHRQQKPHQRCYLPAHLWPQIFPGKEWATKRQLVCAVDGSEKFVYIWLQIEIRRRKFNQQWAHTTTRSVIPSFSYDNAETNVFIGSNIPSFLCGWSSFPFLFCSVYFMEVMESRGQRASENINE